MLMLSDKLPQVVICNGVELYRLNHLVTILSPLSSPLNILGKEVY